MSNGFLIFAHNNEEFDYFSLACKNAKLIQKHHAVPISIVTDEDSIDSRDISLFDQVLIQDGTSDNKRLFRNTPTYVKELSFHNTDRCSAYQLSPYEETIIIDADYLIRSNVLAGCWGSEYDFMINKQYTEIVSGRNSITDIINDFSIEMYWATVIYFRKSTFSKALFELVSHIKENYDYYSMIYNLPSKVFRNDFAFAIAIHILGDSEISPLPGKKLHKSFDGDKIHSIENDGTIIFEANINGEPLYTASRGVDIHVMNKWSLQEHQDELR